MISIAGFVPFTTIDFPGRLASVIFMSGCPLRCPFCHNPALQTGGVGAGPSWAEIESFLERRRGKLEGVVLSGGEPLMSAAVYDIGRRIKDMGYALGIHTSGYYPERLREMLSITDWVGLDIKAPWDKYDLLSGRSDVAPQVRHSLELLLAHGTVFEARTTCDPRYLTSADITTIARFLHQAGVKTYVLQRYRTFREDTNPPEESETLAFFKDETLQQLLKSLFPGYDVRL